MSLDPMILIKTVGLVGILAIIFAESGVFFGLFLPGDSLLFSAGILAATGYLPLEYLLPGAILAAILGDSFGYWFGRKVGYRIFFKEDSFFFSKKYIDRTKDFYERHGKKTIVLARFVPIVRTLAPILAGVGKMEYKVFLRYNVLGGVLWPTAMLLGGYFLGGVIPNIERFIWPIVGGIIVVSFLPVLFQVLKVK